MVVVLLLATDARGAWSAPFTVARSVSEFPALAVSPRGDATVAWLDPDPLSMMARRITVRGRLEPPRTVTTDLGDWPSPKLAVSRSGAAVIAWPRNDADGSEVLVRRMSAAGRLGPVRRIAVERGVRYDSLDVQLAMDAAGNATVAWRRVVGHDVEPKGVAVEESTIRFRRFEKDGTLGRVIQIPPGDGFDSSPHLAVEPSGRGVIAWLHTREGHYQVRAVLLDRVGALGSPQDVSVPSPYWSGEPVEVALDRAGKATIVWLQSDGGARAVAARQMSSRALGPLHVLAPASQEDTFAGHRVIAPMRGVATVGWTVTDRTGSTRSLHARQIRAGELGPRRQISPSSSGFAPAFAGDSRGRTTIVWEQSDGHDADSRFFLRARAIDRGGRLGVTLTLNPRERSSYFQWPVAGVDARGVVTVAWSTRSRGGEVMRAARFTPRHSR